MLRSGTGGTAGRTGRTDGTRGNLQYPGVLPQLALISFN